MTPWWWPSRCCPQPRAAVLPRYALDWISHYCFTESHGLYKESNGHIRCSFLYRLFYAGHLGIFTRQLTFLWLHGRLRNARDVNLSKSLFLWWILDGWGCCRGRCSLLAWCYFLCQNLCCPFFYCRCLLLVLSWKCLDHDLWVCK